MRVWERSHEKNIYLFLNLFKNATTHIVNFTHLYLNYLFIFLFQKLASSYDSLSKAYTKVVDVTVSGKRLLGKYFRIAFFGVKLLPLNLSDFLRMKNGPKLVWKNGWNMFFLTIKIIDFLYFQSSYFVEEDGKEYIYKEPKVTSLAEICERLKNMYSEKYGKDTVKLIMDSNKVLKPGLHVCILKQGCL